jgi:hypothetical protein
MKRISFGRRNRKLIRSDLSRQRPSELLSASLHPVTDGSRYSAARRLSVPAILESMPLPSYTPGAAPLWRTRRSRMKLGLFTGKFFLVSKSFCHSAYALLPLTRECPRILGRKPNSNKSSPMSSATEQLELQTFFSAFLSSLQTCTNATFRSAGLSRSRARETSPDL